MNNIDKPFSEVTFTVAVGCNASEVFNQIKAYQANGMFSQEMSINLNGVVWPASIFNTYEEFCKMQRVICSRNKNEIIKYALTELPHYSNAIDHLFEAAARYGVQIDEKEKFAVFKSIQLAGNEPSIEFYQGPKHYGQK